MANLRLQPFSLDHRFLPEAGKEDKIVLMLGFWDVAAKADDFEIFKDHLAGPPLKHQELAFNGDEPSEHSWLYCRPANQGRYRNQLRIRAQALRHPHEKRLYRRPLLSGWIQFRGIPADMRSKFPQGKRLQLNLALNLLRFIRHQPAKTALSDGDDWPKAPRLTERHGDRSSFKSEHSFDGEDNWLPNERVWNAIATPAKCRAQLRLYLEKVVNVFRRDMKRAAKQARVGMPVRTQEYHSLKTVEIAWEFSSKNSILEAEELGRAALKVCSASRERHYQFKVGETSRTLNSTCFAVSLAENIELRIYAKTNRRIRFEVVQNNLWKKWKPLLTAAKLALLKQKGGERWLTEVAENERSLEELMLVFKQLRRRAADELNAFMEDLRETRPEKSPCRTLGELAGVISAAMPHGMSVEKHSRIMRDVLLLLCRRRKIAGGIERQGELTPVLKRLHKQHVIRWIEKRRAYMLAPDFACPADCFELLDGKRSFAMWHRPKA